MPFPPYLREPSSGPGDHFDIQIEGRGTMRLRLPSSNRSPGRLLWEFFSHKAATTASRRREQRSSVTGHTVRRRGRTLLGGARIPPYRPGASRKLGRTLGKEHRNQGFARLGSTLCTHGNARNNEFFRYTERAMGSELCRKLCPVVCSYFE